MKVRARVTAEATYSVELPDEAESWPEWAIEDAFMDEFMDQVDFWDIDILEKS